MTDAKIVLTYIADPAPKLDLLSAVGTAERYQALRWMAYIQCTLHWDVCGERTLL